MKDMICSQCGQNLKIKKCARCKLIKNNNNFPMQLSNKDGLSGYCFECEAKMIEEYKSFSEKAGGKRK